MKTLKTAKSVALACAVACTGAFAQEAAPAAEPSNPWSYTPGEGISFDEQPVFTAEFGLAFDSKYMTYGVVDGKDPILTPSAYGTFFDWFYIGVEAIFDTTKQGRSKYGDYGNRAGKYTTLDMVAGIAHEFDLDDDGHTLGVDANYIYEYLPHKRYEGCPDTQYLNLELTLGGFWVEPTLAIERDIMADEGTYANLNVGHTFTLVGDEEEQVLTFKPSVGQGVGNSLRTKGYFAQDDGKYEGFNHGGLMDTTIMGEFEWAINDWLSLGAYIAYYDYWFDSNMRGAAREYNAAWGNGEDKSWNVVCGLSMTATF